MWTTEFPENGTRTLRTLVQAPDGTWSQTDFPGPIDGFGRARMATAGDVLAVTWGGVLSVYRLDEERWSEEWTYSDASLEGFGRSVAVSAPEGGAERIVVGAAGQSNPTGSGVVSVFRRTDRWELEQAIDAPRSLVEPWQFGWAVALDGANLAVSAPYPGNSEILLYGEEDGQWLETDVIEVPEWLHPRTGLRLALLGDILAATSSEWSPDNIQVVEAVVQVFHRGPDGWDPRELLLPEVPTVHLGYDLSLSSDGNTTVLTAATMTSADNLAILTGAWRVHLHEGYAIQSTRLRHPRVDVDGFDAPTCAAWPVEGDHPWTVLAGPISPRDPLLRIVEVSGCTVAADLDGDGVVDGADLGVLLSNWGRGGLGDLDGDGTVDGSDLGLLLAACGESAS